MTVLLANIFIPARAQSEDAIPLAEHPRPDFQRSHWINLNGRWGFRLDPDQAGERESWHGKPPSFFSERIVVPFPWGSPLSRVEDRADIAWYSRPIRIPPDWQRQRTFLLIGASDWETKAWLDGKPLGEHRGGYTPFEFELTSYLQPGKEQHLVIRVDDAARPFKLEGKQGYGEAKGIWQTVYLEARAAVYIETLQFTPNIDQERVAVQALLSEPVGQSSELKLRFKTGNPPASQVVQPVPAGSRQVSFEVSIPEPQLWSLNDPFLYEVQAALSAAGGEDIVDSYFGMRKISVERLPGLGFPYVALNNEPIYLQMSLDQAYHPEGFYTFPSDEFMRDEILRSKRIGLNGARIHVKIGIPRKLYWADRLGLLIMEDVPNSWGEPDAQMRRETETALRGMIRRDFNHPSIFSWVVFNETWGLETNDEYKVETQEWVAAMYRLAKELDPTRLVEDNSPHKFDHVVTDINSWHRYLPGYRWREHLEEVTSKTFPGSEWNFVQGRSQGEQPLLNSEFGNVWGYEGSTGDVDWSWDYHLAVNEFRRHPKIAGWLYTEHHDVINEWNGYYRFDRSEKIAGLTELAEGMTLNDLHSPFYVAPGDALCQEVEPGAGVRVPLWASFLTGNTAHGRELVLRWKLFGWNRLGQKEVYSRSSRQVPFAPWMSQEIPALEVRMPDEPALVVLSLALEDMGGTVLHRNFTTFLVADGRSDRDETLQFDGRKIRLLRIAPGSFSDADWSLKQWDVLEGLKVNGAGSGFFEYRLIWPGDLKLEDVQQASFQAEVSAKQLYGKDREGTESIEGNFMLGKGTHDPSLNRNAYPMTDQVRFPSRVSISIGGEVIGTYELEDDPADHRGILSWNSQKRDGHLREAGSYGYLITAAIPVHLLKKAAAAGEMVIRLKAEESLSGGLAIYGER
ncbi:MAG: glycoside hydrolase family 2 protein, partial [Acidobacteriota bacterium]